MDAQLQCALDYIATRKYQWALGKLQYLVIQRLFELHKLNIAQTGIHGHSLTLHDSTDHQLTGYKACTHIAKNLQWHCSAIRNAVKMYNEAALALTPPCETLNWTTASHFSFLEEFALLQDTRKDIREKPWAQPAVRKLMRLSQRLFRAREEVKNVNCEVRRVHTSIRDEEILFHSVLEDLRKEGTPLYGAVEDDCRHWRVLNARNVAYIQVIYSLPGFSGNPTPGNRKGAFLPAPPQQSSLDDLVAKEMSAIQQGQSIEATLDEDDQMNQDVTVSMDYLAALIV